MPATHGGVPVPKPEPLKRTRARRQRTDAQRLNAWRDAVWTREMAKLGMHDSLVLDTADAARCQGCGCWVFRDVDPESSRFGQVHHRIGRRAKATRYDPDNGVLLCGPLLNDCHGKAQRHEIEV